MVLFLKNGSVPFLCLVEELSGIEPFRSSVW